MKRIFKLNKWYLDCVTENGQCFIFYAAELQWKQWRIVYSSTLFRNIDDSVSSNWKIKKVQFPKHEKDLITWEDASFKVKAYWHAMGSPLEALLFNGQKGFLQWNCYQPLALAQVQFKDQDFRGLGYTEHLKLTTYPWDIPMKALRWGRFASENMHLVWINYYDNESLEWVWLNGKKIDNWIITDTFLHHKEKAIRLVFTDTYELVKEQKIFNVFKNLFKFLPGFKRIIPSNFLTSYEKKWLSRSRLEIGENEIAAGWSVHEYVNFEEGK